MNCLFKAHARTVQSSTNSSQACWQHRHHQQPGLNQAVSMTSVAGGAPAQAQAKAVRFNSTTAFPTAFFGTNFCTIPEPTDCTHLAVYCCCCCCWCCVRVCGGSGGGSGSLLQLLPRGKFQMKAGVSNVNLPATKWAPCLQSWQRGWRGWRGGL